ncbi:MAG: chemotaxis protein CheB [Elusimicrobiota bacterium]
MPKDTTTPPIAQTTSPRAPFYIAGVGASAGGLDAFKALLRPLPADIPLALVLIQHMDPNRKSLLAEILSRETDLPVAEITDGETVRPGRVYVIPSGRHLSIREGRLRLSPRADSLATIDHFFRSLAADRGPRSAGVVLSGTGQDGSRGLRAIKEAGGATFAQDAGSAGFSGMPVSALDSGFADYVLPPERIGEALARLGRGQSLSAFVGARKERQIKLGDMYAILRAQTRVDFTAYKKETLERRVARRMAMLKMRRLEDYLRHLAEHPAEVQRLYEDLLITVTRFFRDPKIWTALREKILPGVLAAKAPRDTVRVWVPACSTGEEVYSLGMTLLELLEERGRRTAVQIFGTDIHEGNLQKARQGAYPAALLRDMAPERLRRFFVKKDDQYLVRRELREACLFSKQDVTQDPPFSRLDMVSCRNLLIYFSPDLQARVLSIFHYALVDGGLLLLGPSENALGSPELFETADKRLALYRKTAAVSAAAFNLRSTRGRGPSPSTPGPKAPSNAWNEATPGEALDHYLLSQNAPPALLINAELEVLHSRGPLEPFLAPFSGSPSFNLRKVGRPGLAAVVEKAAREADRRKGPAARHWLRAGARGLRKYECRVTPLSGPLRRARRYMVLFKVVEAARAPAAPPARSDKAADEVLLYAQQLESELSAARDYMHKALREKDTAYEELRAANEEIMSSNEELQSTNEELETAKEELQSANEELITVNDELKNTLERVRELNDKLEEAQQIAQLGHWEWDIASDKIVWSDELYRIFGLSPREGPMTYEAYLQKLPLEDRQAQRERVRGALEDGKPFELLRRIVWPDGQARFLSTRGRVIRDADGRAVRMVGTTQDVTEAKKIQGALESQTAMLQAVLEQAADGVIVYDRRGNRTLVNAAARRLAGLDPDGRTLDLPPGDWGAVYYPDGRPMPADHWPVTRALRGEAAAGQQVRMLRPDGTAYDLLMGCAPIRNAAGDVVGAVATFTDITARRRAEEKAAALNRELEAARDAALESVRAKSQFLANMSHEIRTPLNAVVGMSSLLMDGALDVRRQEQVKIVHDSAVSLLGVINDILDFSKMEAGKLSLEPGVFELGPLLESCLNLFRLQAKEKGLELEWAVAAGTPPRLVGDHGRVRQILVNLLSNAVKFAARGRVKVAARAESSNGGKISLLTEVSDQGPGIPAADRDKLFKPFSQLDSSMTRRYGGAGLGLAICKELTQMMGGEIGVRSEEGSGSTFWFRLPLAVAPADGAAESPGLPALPPPRAEDFASLSVLVAEDNAVNRKVLLAQLERLGVAAEAVSNGREAVEAAARSRYDLILMDCQMPELDGYEAAERIRRSENGGRRTPIVAVTAHVLAGDRERCFQAGMDEYISKPVELSELAAVLSRHGRAEKTQKPALA